MLAGAEEVPLKLGEMGGLQHGARQDAAAAAHGGGRADGLADMRAGRHDAAGGEGDVARADDAAGEEQVGEVAAVEAAVGNRVNPFGVPLGATGLRAEHSLGRVHVDGPAAERHRVLMRALLDDVVLREDVIALEAPALALAGDHAHPLERQVFRLRKFPRILDVVPDPVNDLPELPFDPFRVVHGVEQAAVLDPPQFAAVFPRVELPPARDPRDVLQCEGRRGVSHRAAGVAGVEIERVPEQLARGAGGRETLAEFFARFGAHAERGAREEAHDAVAGGVAEQRRVQVVSRRRLRAEAVHRGDRGVVPLGDFVDRGVEQQRDVRLGGDLLEQEGVNQQRVALRVAEHVLDQDLVDHAALAGPAVVVTQVGRRAQDPEPYLARGVATQHRTVLHEDDLEAGAGGGNGAAGAGETATDDHEIGGEIIPGERPGSDGRMDEHRMNGERKGRLRLWWCEGGVARQGAKRAGAGAA